MIRLLIFCLLTIPTLATGQSVDRLLERAMTQYQRDEWDMANALLQQAWERADGPDQETAVLIGMARVALAQYDLAATDSLLRRAEAHPERAARVNQLRLQQVRAEYYRQNSQFDQALSGHLTVLRDSRSLPDTTLVRPYALYYTALTWEKRTRYDSALIYAQRAEAAFAPLLTADDPRWSTIYNGLGACYFRANQLDRARSYFERSAQISTQHYGSVSGQLARTLNNLSAVARMQEDYRQAVAYAERALPIFRELDDPNGEAGIYYSLGIYYYYLGDYGRTHTFLERCIGLRQKLFHEHHASLIGPYELLAVTLEEAGKYRQLLPQLAKARRIIRANYPPGSVLEGFNYENTATAYSRLGQLDSALHYVALAHEILPLKLPPDDYALGVHYYVYAELLLARGDITLAERYLLKSARIYEKIGLDQSVENAQQQVLRGQIAAARGNWPRAEILFAQAIKGIALPGETRITPIPQALVVLQAYAKFQFDQYLQNGQSEALALFAQAAQDYQTVSQQMRAQFADPYTRAILAKENAQAYRFFLGCYAKLCARTDNPQYLQSLFALAEYSRAARLRDLAGQQIPAYAHLPDSLLDREMDLRHQLETQQQAYLDHPQDSSRRSRYAAARTALSAHIDFLRKHHPQYYQLRFQREVATLEEVREKLSEAEALIEYMRDDSLFYALIITREEVFWHPLAEYASTVNLIEQWRQQIQEQDLGYRTSSTELYRRLWAPFAHRLRGIDRVTIAPVDQLFYLNLAALTDDSGQYLLPRYHWAYTLSASLLDQSSAVADPAGPGLAIAPGFDEATKRRYRDLVGEDGFFLRIVRQPWSQRLARKLQSSGAFQALTGWSAREARVKALLPESRIIYFGTHAIADAREPLRSRLLLTQDGQGQEDGYLHAYEWYGLSLKAELTLLNACESGIGALQEGEGMVSLAHAIRYAGCPSTTLSLWKVDEKSSTQITEATLSYLQEGYPRDQALQQAQMDFLAQAPRDLQHPFYWGGIVLMGENDPISWTAKRSPWWYLCIPVFFLLVYTRWADARKMG